MNKLSLLILGVALSGAAAQGAGVKTDVATAFGSQFLEHIDGKSRSLKGVVTQNSEYIIANYAPQGWAIIAADDAAQPIIGYSPAGQLQWFNLPDNMGYMLKTYREQIKQLRASGTSSHRGWVTGVEAPATSRSVGDVIEPLIKVNWNQTRPYNNFCPQNALVGCVAVSMSQAMSVQRYPSQPQGSVSYTSGNYGKLEINFDEEIAYNWSNILSGANNFNETARLLYHAGMSVFMNYGTEGSGIPSNEIYRISNALVNNFNYPTTVQYYYRDRYTDDRWEQMVLNELMAGRAVIYNAIDTKGNYGHSFNVDGYDGERYYHLNWGWGGYGNGYFSLNSLSDAAMDMNYDAGHRIVIGIGAPDSPFRSLDLSDTRIEAGIPAGSAIANIMVNGEVAGSDLTITARGRYNSYDQSYEEVPFSIDGSLLRTTRSFQASEVTQELMINIRDNAGHEYTQGFTLTIEAPKTIEESTKVTFNRNTGLFTVNTKHNVSYTLVSATGAVISQGSLEPLPMLKFYRSDLAPGANTLTLTSGSDSKKIIIRN